jgi:hypothetical protein
VQTLTQKLELEIKWPSLGYEALPHEAKAVMNHLKTAVASSSPHATLLSRYTRLAHKQTVRFI